MIVLFVFFHALQHTKSYFFIQEFVPNFLALLSPFLSLLFLCEDFCLCIAPGLAVAVKVASIKVFHKENIL